MITAMVAVSVVAYIIIFVYCRGLGYEWLASYGIAGISSVVSGFAFFGIVTAVDNFIIIPIQAKRLRDQIDRGRNAYGKLIQTTGKRPWKNFTFQRS